MNFRFSVLQGGAVYLDSTRDPNAGVFIVNIDNVQMKIDGYAASTQNACSFTWSKAGLTAGFHNLTIVFDGPSPQSPAKAPGSFELNGIQYVPHIFDVALAERSSAGLHLRTLVRNLVECR